MVRGARLHRQVSLFPGPDGVWVCPSGPGFHGAPLHRDVYLFSGADQPEPGSLHRRAVHADAHRGDERRRLDLRHRRGDDRRDPQLSPRHRGGGRQRDGRGRLVRLQETE